jgi:hypothetical protein
MAQPPKRRDHGEDAIYWDEKAAGDRCCAPESVNAE